MKILHIVEDYSLESGGLRTVIKNLDFYLKSVNIDSYIISSKKEEEDDIKIIQSDNIWMYNKNWASEILKNIEINKINIVHIHGVWMFPQFIAARVCIENKIPFMITPHGMYEPWLWKKSGLKKKIYFNFLAKKLFGKAKYIHAITSDEENNLRKLFLSNDFIKIPNLISVKKKSNEEINLQKYILYLGRLDSKKGIDILIKSFSKIQNSNFTLKIAGTFNPYKLELEKLIRELSIDNKVEFLGLVKNKQKEDIIKNAWVLIAPSHSEVIGMVNLEAAALKTPVITTYQTGIEKGWNTNGGVLINPTEDDLDAALAKAVNWSKEKRKNNGEELFNYVREEYSWEKKIYDWKKAYKALL